MKLEFKKNSDPVWHEIIAPIIYKYNLDFFPKIHTITPDGYEYEYVDGPTLEEYINEGNEITQKDIIEIKIQLDHVFKILFEISLKESDKLLNKYMWYHDPILANLIWDFKKKKLTLIDIDSICFGSRVPISYINNLFLQPLEYELHKENLRTFTRTL